MAVERFFDVKDIQELLDKNAGTSFGRRNAALIMGAVYWGLTAQELSLLSVNDVIAETGDFYMSWVLPKHTAYNGEERTCYTKEHMLDFFDNYAEWRKQNNIGLSNLAAYRNLDPNSKFFLNNRGEPYKLSPRKAGSGEYQPRSMNEQLKRMIKRTGLHGATPSSFRDSFIRELYNNGCKWEDLMAVTGIKQKRTLERKVRRKELELEKIFKNLYSRVRNPRHA